MHIYHGTILTVDANDSVAEWLVEKDGRIAYVGNELPGLYAGMAVEELGERALCPAFTDTHEHLASFATFNAGLNVMDARSNKEIIERVAAFAQEGGNGLVIAFGASPYSVADGRLVSREELDEACPDRPCMVVKYDGHACTVNSALLAKIDKKVRELRGYHPDTGEMNQEAFFAVSDYVSGSLPIPALVANTQHAMDYLAERGIGCVHTVSGVGFVLDLDITLETLLAKSAESGFAIRVFPQSLDIKAATSRGLPRIGGCFACALDGCYGSADAAMLEPYADGSGSGVLYYSNEKVADFCKKANRAGLQIELHAIGDAAFEQAAFALKAALDDYPRKDHRHGIIHACLPTERALDVCAEYGIQFPMQTSFIGWPQEPDSYLEVLLGKERNSRLNPLRTYWDKGIVISAGSDAPCTDPDPILWMERACNHTVAEERLTIQEALRMCTYNGAWACFDEGERGSLEVGKGAHMVVLSENPYQVPTSELGRIKVEKTLLNGEPYKQQSQGVATALLRGLMSKNKA